MQEWIRNFETLSVFRVKLYRCLLKIIVWDLEHIKNIENCNLLDSGQFYIAWEFVACTVCYKWQYSAAFFSSFFLLLFFFVFSRLMYHPSSFFFYFNESLIYLGPFQYKFRLILWSIMACFLNYISHLTIFS